MIFLKVKPNFVSKYKSGYPLIQKDAIYYWQSMQEEGQLVTLMDEKNNFIGQGYYGRQNKGYGWLLSWKEGESIDQAFFQRRIKTALEGRKSFYEDSSTTAFRVF